MVKARESGWQTGQRPERCVQHVRRPQSQRSGKASFELRLRRWGLMREQLLALRQYPAHVMVRGQAVPAL